jgi:hypothetical protein
MSCLSYQSTVDSFSVPFHICKSVYSQDDFHITMKNRLDTAVRNRQDFDQKPLIEITALTGK